MKEAFIAALVSIGANPDNEVRLMEFIAPVKNTAGEVTITRHFVPAISAADFKTDIKPHVIRHITD